MSIYIRVQMKWGSPCWRLLLIYHSFAWAFFKASSWTFFAITSLLSGFNHLASLPATLSQGVFGICSYLAYSCSTSPPPHATLKCHVRFFYVIAYKQMENAFWVFYIRPSVCLSVCLPFLFNHWADLNSHERWYLKTLRTCSFNLGWFLRTLCFNLKILR